MAALSRGTIFPADLVTEMFNKVKGKSSLAKLAPAEPMPFTGKEEVTFSMDHDVSIVAENGAKVHGGVTATPVTIIPVKFEYGARVSDEFKYASEEVRLQYLRAFADGFAKKLARGFDIAAMHGINPYAGTASTVVGNNHFDYAIQSGNIITYAAASADANVDSALAALEANGYQGTGIAMSTAMRSAIAALTVSGARKYPEFAFGATPATLGAMTMDVNPTVAVALANATADKALVGDFSAFKWGYAKEIPLEIIEYGCPDNDTTAGDLKGHNQVYLRSEAYIGWGILDANAFALIQ